MIICSSTARHGSCTRQAAEAGGGSPVRGGDWFTGRRDHFVRQAIGDFFHLASLFTELYASWRGSAVGAHPSDDATSGRLQAQLAAMVGTERDNGPLWQLKDRCHRIWPQERRGEHVRGVLVDWLVGSLFHEAMKLKENLYLLAAYRPAAVAIGGFANRDNGPDRPDAAIVRMVDLRTMVGRIAGDVDGQMERIGLLFAQTNYLLRMMLPELAVNPLVLRLCMEMEEVVAELWGESLEDLFTDTFGGRPAVGFCLIGSSYLRGQWYRQALTAYRRALSCERECDEAIVSAARIEAILRELPEHRPLVQ
ncbi:MAG: hypothetical protein RBS95_10275 [Desulfobulbus sp.]|jgi:hypothetical protein|nr:hypothetical protein [Desulfobulbus sp.]